MLLAMAVALAIAAPGAGRNHSLKDHLSIGPTGGNANVDLFFDFAPATARGCSSRRRSRWSRATPTRVRHLPAAGRHHHPDLDRADRRQRRARACFRPASRATGRTCSSRPTSSSWRPTRTGSSTSIERSGGTTNALSTGPTGGNGGLDVFFHGDLPRRLAGVLRDRGAAGRRRHRRSGRRLRARGGHDHPGLDGPPAATASFRRCFDGISDGRHEGLLRDGRAAHGGRHRRVLRRVPALGRHDHAGCRPARPAATAPWTRPSERIVPGRRARLLRDSGIARRRSDTDANPTSTSARAGPPRWSSARGGNGAFDAIFEGSSSDGARVFFETREPLRAGDTDAPSTCTSAPAGPPSSCLAGPPAATARSTRASREPLPTARASSSRPRKSWSADRHGRLVRRVRAAPEAPRRRFFHGSLGRQRRDRCELRGRSARRRTAC